MGRMTRVGAAAAAVVLTVGLAACGDDDDEATTDTSAEDAGGEAAAGGDVEEFCSSLLEFNTLVNESEAGNPDASEEDIKAAGEELAPLFQRVTDNAPEGASDPADELNPTVQALLEGDASEFSSDETFATYTELTDAAADPCEWQSQAVTAVDYAFEGIPASLTAGTYSFELTNQGQEQHEMIVFRKADGVTQSIEEIVELPEEESESLVEFAGAGFAPPGESSSALIELEAGEYGVVCFIPVGTTADASMEEVEEGGESGPPHFTQGMLAEFTVE